MGNVRKASMFCTVDLYKVLGDELMPHLSQLSVSQMKIVTMYMEKANKQSERYIGDSVSQQTVHVMIT